MGPRSTAPFIDQVVSEFQRQCGARVDTDFPPMVILAWPTPFYVDRPMDHDAMQESIAAGLRRLERCKVDFIAMPSNTAHIFYESLVPHLKVPLINMIEETSKALPDSARRIAILATRPTVQSCIYQDSIYANCQNLHTTLVLDTEPWQVEVDELIKTVKTARNRKQAEAKWRELLDLVKREGADAAIIACTDISTIADLVHSPIPLIDAAQCLASATVRWWRLAE
jgi:amino-acid racemase